MNTHRLFRHIAPFALALGTMTALGCSGGHTGDGADPAEEGATAATTQRPPQFVMLAFDGSLNLDFWQESRTFAQQTGAKFTYFASGAYFLPEAKKALYHGPRHAAGHSDIGFGGPAANIGVRLNHVRQAYAEGHEIASHANGHFDGSAWSEAEWDDEFEQFDKLIFNAAETAGVPHVNLGFGIEKVKGFRAPLLGFSSGMFKTLKKKQFSYDTSKSGEANYWPEKQDGIWNFPLAELRIVGSGKHTLSMDYNFYYAHSKGEPKPENKETYKKETLDTYMQYFQNNYFGNRAPVHIGHHFSKWNGGAYWEAMQAFTKKVCGLPEVKCVTYGELAKFMESHASDRASYQASAFAPLPRPPGIAAATPVEPAIPVSQREAAGLVGDVAAAHEE